MLDAALAMVLRDGLTVGLDHISFEDIDYRYHPYDEPITGREAVVASWLGEDTSNGASTRDAPGTYAAHYAPVAVDDDVVVATGTSIYRKRPDGRSLAFMTTAS
jgi:hypothetical protein